MTNSKNLECANPRQERIPASLQAVFIQSAIPDVPPPKQSAQKVFHRNWKSDETPSSQSTSENVSEISNKKISPRVEETKEEPSSDADEQTLQQHFDFLLAERGYDVQCFETLKTGYYTKASDVQIASYGPRMTQIVKTGDSVALREALGAGLSANPCNQFGESLLHMVCRRGDMDLLQVFVQAGANLQTSDDHGRTPLHDACWTAQPAFDVVETILQLDLYMFFLKDARGALPLSYVQKSDWAEWKEWLDKNVDTYFSREGLSSFAPTDLCAMEPNTVPYALPKSELSLSLIQMVANGNLTPFEAQVLADDGDESTMADTVSCTDYDLSEFDETETEFDELENDEIVQMFQMAAVRGRQLGF